jgi:hypothetical protein
MWEDSYSSAVLSGIVGDPAHQARGGYHISIEDQSPSNYSVVRPDDKAPPGNWPRNLAAGTDMSMSRADMITDWHRMRAVWLDHTDPRRKYLNAYNGWDGVGSAKRLDFVTGTQGTATDDHKWHGHEEKRRRYVTDPVATNAIASIHMGWTKQQWLESNGGTNMGRTAHYGAGINGQYPNEVDNTWDMQLKLQDLGWLREATPPPGVTWKTWADHPVTGADGKYGDDTKWSIANAPVKLTGGDSTGSFFGPWEVHRLDIESYRSRCERERPRADGRGDHTLPAGLGQHPRPDSASQAVPYRVA